MQRGEEQDSHQDWGSACISVINLLENPSQGSCNSKENLKFD